MSDSSPTPLRVAVLISGGGTTLRNLIEKQRAGQLPIEFRLVISSSPSARGLDFARDAGIPTRILQQGDYEDTKAYSEAIFESCRREEVELVVMGGFLKHVLIPPDFAERVMNIHPSLIPAFCGKGYYGRRVHQAALDYGVRVSGCTVHWVDDHYDHGPIILQRVVAVHDGDTAESLAARVFEEECEALPEAIRLVATKQLATVGRRVRIISEA